MGQLADGRRIDLGQRLRPAPQVIGERFVAEDRLTVAVDEQDTLLHGAQRQRLDPASLPGLLATHAEPGIGGLELLLETGDRRASGSPAEPQAQGHPRPGDQDRDQPLTDVHRLECMGHRPARDHGVRALFVSASPRGHPRHRWRSTSVDGAIGPWLQTFIPRSPWGPCPSTPGP